MPPTAGCSGAIACESHAAQLTMLLIVTAERLPAYMGGCSQSSCVTEPARLQRAAPGGSHGELALYRAIGRAGPTDMLTESSKAARSRAC